MFQWSKFQETGVALLPTIGFVDLLLLSPMAEELFVTGEVATGRSAGPLSHFARGIRRCAAANALLALLRHMIPLLVREKRL